MVARAPPGTSLPEHLDPGCTVDYRTVLQAGSTSGATGAGSVRDHSLDFLNQHRRTQTTALHYQQVVTPLDPHLQADRRLAHDGRLTGLRAQKAVRSFRILGSARHVKRPSHCGPACRRQAWDSIAAGQAERDRWRIIDTACGLQFSSTILLLELHAGGTTAGQDQGSAEVCPGDTSAAPILQLGRTAPGVRFWG